jgi:Tfp pilus assembly protein PilF
LLGYCYLAVDKFLSAEAAYRKAMLFAPDNADWKLGLARCLLAAQRSREAVALFEELIQKDPEKADYWLLQANAFLELAEYSNAARNYEILRRMGKATGASLMALGDIYTNEDLKDLALDAYLASLQKEPNQDLKRPLQAVEIMTNRQAWDQASKLLAQINAIAKSRMKDEERRRALKLESKIALAVGDDKAAVRTLEELIRRDPLDGEAMLLLAGYYGRTGEIEHAELLYERATKLRDYEANALVLHAQLLVQQSKYEKAVRLLQQAQQIRPRENVAEYLDQVERLARASAL